MNSAEFLSFIKKMKNRNDKTFLYMTEIRIELNETNIQIEVSS